jgi:hypothetical protein
MGASCRIVDSGSSDVEASIHETTPVVGPSVARIESGGLSCLAGVLPSAAADFDLREKGSAEGDSVNAYVNLRLQNVDVNDDELRASGVRYRL